MDWLDKKLGNFCKMIDKEIEQNPFLSRPIKNKFKTMLEDCVSKAKESGNETTAEFNRNYRKLERSVAKKGKPLSKKMFV